jgi:hypothetical protein|eukprot:COSAG03_NODE_16_length_21807_cov_27.080247_15_plen_116_part_00
MRWKSEGERLSRASMQVKNTGQRSGATVVLAFVKGDGQATALRKLIGFDKVWLRGGEATTVTFATPARQALSVVDEEGRRWMRAGGRALEVGGGPTGATWEMELAGPDTVVLELL